jgi:FAD dependent oxidoreductase
MAARLHVAILGAGIMGSATALFLARRGIASTLFDQAAEPFSRASRWNEGKIHLGYLYSADPTLETARRLMPGGLAFNDLVEGLIGPLPAHAVTKEGDVYVVHRDSVVTHDAMARYFTAVTDLVREAPMADRYLGGGWAHGLERLSPRELAGLADDRFIVAGFRVPERSVSTNRIADRFVAALAAEPRIELAMGSRVKRVRPHQPTVAGRWTVDTAEGARGPFDFVVNALWEGRLAIDAALGLAPEPGWSHRYRRSLFVRTSKALDVPSVVVATGPFGDVKNYNGRDLYLSWYPAGLAAEGNGVDPPEVAEPDAAGAAAVAESIIGGLASHLPWVTGIWAKTAEWRLEGGWVFALGKGSLADPRASLHRRDRIGLRRVGTYLSVDTGKYSIAPWTASQLAELIASS